MKRYYTTNLKRLTPKELETLGAAIAKELFETKKAKNKPILKSALLDIAITHWEKTRGGNHGTQ